MATLLDVAAAITDGAVMMVITTTALIAASTAGPFKFRKTMKHGRQFIQLKKMIQ